MFWPISGWFEACFGLFWIELDRFGACFGVFRTKLEYRPKSDCIGLNRKRKKRVQPRMHVQPCPLPHGVSVRIRLACIGPIGAPVLPRWTLILGFCLNLWLPKRVLLLQSLWLHHQSKYGIYGMSIFGLYKLVFHQKQMF